MSCLFPFSPNCAIQRLFSARHSFYIQHLRFRFKLVILRVGFKKKSVPSVIDFDTIISAIFWKHTASFKWTFLFIPFPFPSRVSQTIFLTERRDARGEEYFVYVIMRQVRMAVTYGRNDKLLMQVSHFHTSYIYLYALSRGNSTAEIRVPRYRQNEKLYARRPSHKPKRK